MKKAKKKTAKSRGITTTRKAAPVGLPSGRTVTLEATRGAEALEVRSPDGKLELRITLTDRGPVLSLKGVRLEIDSTEEVAVNCRRFDLRAAEGITLHAAADITITGDADMRMKTVGDTFIDAKVVNLNCLDRAGYPDPVPPPPVGEGPGKGLADAHPHP